MVDCSCSSPAAVIRLQRPEEGEPSQEEEVLLRGSLRIVGQQARAKLSEFLAASSVVESGYATHAFLGMSLSLLLNA